MTTQGVGPVQSSPVHTAQTAAPVSAQDRFTQSTGLDWTGTGLTDSEVKPKPRATTRKRPAWYTKPHIVAVVVLIVVGVEAVAFGLVGWIWWVVANLALLVVAFLAALAWRRKGKGGLLDKLLGGKSSRRSTGARTGGSGGGRWPGQGSRSAGRPRGSSAGGSSGGRLGKMRAALGRKRKNQAAGSTGPGTSGAGSSTAGRKRKFGLPGRKKAATRTGSSTGSSGGSSTGPTGSSGRKKNRNFRLPWSKPKGSTQTPGAAPQPKHTGRPDGSKPSPHPRRDSPPQQRQSPTPDAKTEPAKTSTTEPKHQTDPRQTPAGPNQKEPDMTGPTGDTGIGYSDDQSLQRWGRNLGTIEQAIAEGARLYAEAEAYKAKLASALSAIRNQAENELPASGRVRADVEALEARARTASSADELRAVAADAAALPAVYRNEHEVDEARLNGGRGGREREKRADVTIAEQDN